MQTTPSHLAPACTSWVCLRAEGGGRVVAAALLGCWAAGLLGSVAAEGALDARCRWSGVSVWAR